MIQPRLRRALAWLLVLAAGLVVQELAAIVVAPTALYLTDGRPASAVTLYNPSDVPEEVTVEARFGYPTTDAEGRVRLELADSVDDPRSSADWIQALPRRLVVPPGERRVVRVLARPPADLPDGEYWTRLVLTSRGQRLPVASGDSGNLRVGLDLAIRTIIAVTYRKGEVRTGVAVDDFEPRVEGDSLVVRPNLTRREEGAFVGRLDFSLVDAEGEIVREWVEQVAVYRTYHRRYAYDVSSVGPGRYELRLRLGTDREDIQAADRLPATPVDVSARVLRR